MSAATKTLTIKEAKPLTPNQKALALAGHKGYFVEASGKTKGPLGGRITAYLVHVMPDGYLKCACKASRFNPSCPHKDALKAHLEQQQGCPIVDRIALVEALAKVAPNTFFTKLTDGTGGSYTRQHCAGVAIDKALHLIGVEAHVSPEHIWFADTDGSQASPTWLKELHRDLAWLKRPEILAGDVLFALTYEPPTKKEQAPRHATALPAYATDNTPFSIFKNGEPMNPNSLPIEAGGPLDFETDYWLDKALTISSKGLV